MDTILAGATFYNVSLTKVPTVMDAREVRILVTGSHRPLLCSRPLRRG